MSCEPNEEISLSPHQQKRKDDTADEKPFAGSGWNVDTAILDTTLKNFGRPGGSG